MREIEIKARAQNVDKLRKNLDALGVALHDPITQHDVVYSRPGAIDNDPNECWLRIRTENKSIHTLTLKKSVTGDLDSIEHEVQVDNASELAAMISLLGYELYSDLTKIRQKAKFGEYEICLDTVPELGTFIEIEKLCPDDADANAIQRELWAIMEKLGVSRDDEETSGYDVLQRKLAGIAPTTI